MMSRTEVSDNVIQFHDRLAERVARTQPRDSRFRPGSVDGGGGDDDPPDMSEISDRVYRLEGAYDALKVVRPMTVAVVAILLTAAIGAIALLGVQVTRLDGQVARLDGKIDTNAERLNAKLDAIPQRLADEFRAMRAEMAAQTTAIASAVTASKQTPPQVLLVPVQPQQQQSPDKH
jgi:hypothetical protein